MGAQWVCWAQQMPPSRTQPWENQKREEAAFFSCSHRSQLNRSNHALFSPFPFLRGKPGLPGALRSLQAGRHSSEGTSPPLKFLCGPKEVAVRTWRRHPHFVSKRPRNRSRPMRSEGVCVCVCKCIRSRSPHCEPREGGRAGGVSLKETINLTSKEPCPCQADLTAPEPVRDAQHRNLGVGGQEAGGRQPGLSYFLLGS